MKSLLLLAALVAAPTAPAQPAEAPVTVRFVTPADAVAGGGSYPLAVGGTGADRILAVAIGPAGSTYVVGDFLGTFDFDPGPATVPATSQGGTDLFIASYAPDGAFRFGYVIGGPLNEVGTGAAFANGVAYVGGTFYGTVNFGGAAGSITSQGSADGFVLAINGTTGALLWASAFGGALADGNPELAAASGRVFAVARFIGPADFDDGPGQAILNSVDSYDAALAAFDAGTGAHLWSRVLFGGPGQQFEGGIDVATGEVVYAAANSFGNRNGVVGAYDSATGVPLFETPLPDVTPFDVESTGSQLIVAGAALPAPGASDVFLASYAGATGTVQWTRTVGGPGLDQAAGVDFVGPEIVIGGQFEGTVDFDPGAGMAERTSAGGADAFVGYYRLADGAFLAAERFGSTGADAVYDVDGGATSGPVVGQFEGTVDLNPSPGQTETRTAVGAADGFVTLYAPGGGTAAEPAPEVGLALEVVPNPAQGATTLRWGLSAAGRVSVVVYDLLGREVARLAEGVRAAPGWHTTPLAAGLAAGVYVVRLTAERGAATEVRTRRLVVIR